jgi:hypothetical protein
VIPAIALPGVNKGDFGQKPVVATHNLAESELFTDTALCELLDGYPRQHLYALTMGTDPLRHEENRLALHDGVSGAALLRAVKSGRLWLNIKHVDQVDARYRALIDQLYAHLGAYLPDFSPDRIHGTLLISSPQAMVYYHADGPASVLWHVRGRKRVWVYPALDARYVEREALEDIFAGVRHEYLPYDHSFDAGAKVYDLEPGQWIAWAQNAPHRVTNLDSVNVSLSTEHFTAQSRRRARVYVANRFLRINLGMRNLSVREVGPIAALKTLVHRVARKAGLDRAEHKRHTPTLRVDPDSPQGVAPLDAVSASSQAYF